MDIGAIQTEKAIEKIVQRQDKSTLKKTDKSPTEPEAIDC